jgi:hypothetical protein
MLRATCRAARASGCGASTAAARCPLNSLGCRQRDARTGVEPNVELEAVDEQRVLEVPLGTPKHYRPSIRSEYREYPSSASVREGPTGSQAGRALMLSVVCRCSLAHRARCAVRCTLSAVGSIGHLAYERVSVGNDFRRIRQDLCDAID